ncbi:MAG: RsmD family RNA methyltransferase [Treponema sp.]|nr:RsmD family RNA methyltransferase [Treponema sp.]
MRITGGTLGGLRIKVPRGEIRPAMDRMRESVFGILGDLSGLSFLDIFSGSGIIALEAASRGASYIEAVEMDPKKRRTLLENAGLSPVRIHCRFMAAELYVERARRSFDLVFMDPPFPYRYKWDLLKSIVESSIIGSNSRILVHRPREDPCPALPQGLVLDESREYGRSIVDFFSFFS